MANIMYGAKMDPAAESRASFKAQPEATMNCQRCGKICCVVCAPAGDQIPAEAMATEALSDRRIPLVTYGLHTPQRVCYPCYFHNHEV